MVAYRQSAFNLPTRPFLPQNNRAPLVEANNVGEGFADINADHGDLTRFSAQHERAS
jgi:hypothetical protein